MNSEHVILCGGLRASATGGVPGLELNAWPAAGRTNLRLDILDLNERFCRTVPGRYYDLLDVATYVFQGDQMFSRGRLDVDNFGNRWRRSFQYHIPVREPDFWSQAEVIRSLRGLLEFLADDFYEFSFYPGKGAPQMQEYLTFEKSTTGLQAPELVMLFSGGLDSLAGAAREIVQNKLHVALVNHQSTDKFGRTYEELVTRLRAKCGVFQPTHLRVEINKKGFEAKDHHQRARSFLYAALGGTVARMLGLRELRFYENGVLSLNLPICGQLVGARATRTTHPRVLAGYRELLTLLAGEKFEVTAPFAWHTKGDVVKEIGGSGCGDLIFLSRSCAHTWQTDNNEPHCGTCSQCLDRRVGVLAAHAEEHDPLNRYHIDVFTQARPKKEDKILGAGFIERANQIGAMRDSSEFLCRYPQLGRALPFMGMSAGAAAEKVFTLYRRHATEVKEAVKRLVAQHSMALVERTLPGDCLLRSVTESGSVTSVAVAAPAAMTAPAEIPVNRNGKGNGNGQGPNEVLAEAEKLLSHGRLRYRPGFEDVWLGDKHYDLRDRTKARLCIEYLVEKKAFDAKSARHLVGEIDPYVRKRGDFLPSAEIKIDHYFNDTKGVLPHLRKDLIAAAGRNGKYFLRVE